MVLLHQVEAFTKWKYNSNKYIRYNYRNTIYWKSVAILTSTINIIYKSNAKFETDLALNGVCMVSMSVSDDESDTPFSASLSGSDLELIYSNANSSSIGLHLTENHFQLQRIFL